jgi:hypothetical protein
MSKDNVENKCSSTNDAIFLIKFLIKRKRRKQKKCIYKKMCLKVEKFANNGV